MEIEAALKDIHSRNFKPVYFMMGEEPFFMDQITDALEDVVLTEDEKAFNFTLVYGKDLDINAIIEEAKQYPVMAENRLVIVKEAQNIKTWDALESYIKQPNPSTVLAFAHKYKNIDKRKSAYKTLNKSGFVLGCDKIKVQHLPAWIKKEVKSQDLLIGEKETQLLAEYIGNNLERLHKEIQKLKVVLGPGGTIDMASIETHIGISKEYNVFELQNALIQGNVKQAMKITHFFCENQKENPLPRLIAFLYSFFAKVISLHYLKDKSDSNLASKLRIPPFVAKQYKEAARIFTGVKTVNIISLLREYDLRSKGLNNKSTEHSELLKELMIKIIGA